VQAARLSGKAFDGMGIKLENVSYIYEVGTAMQTAALEDVSLEIPENQFIGLIGHTGSGKSTLVQLLNGLLKPTEGRVLYNGKNIHEQDYDKRALRAEVGLVFQYPEHQLFEADVLSDVMFGPRNLGLDEAACKKSAVEALTSVGIGEEYFKTSPFDLSGGQKRRVAIAGVLAMHPKILILDEPTAGLDPRGRDEILGLISEMKQKMSMTIILVSHSMDDVARYVERIIVMGHGKKIFDDEPRRVFRHYRELEDLGLSAPQITYILQELKEKGLDLETDALTVAEAADEIIRKLSGPDR
jgi:energy-coupling factor transport system ATP-binding protein